MCVEQSGEIQDELARPQQQVRMPITTPIYLDVLKYSTFSFYSALN